MYDKLAEIDNEDDFGKLIDYLTSITMYMTGNIKYKLGKHELHENFTKIDCNNINQSFSYDPESDKVIEDIIETYQNNMGFELVKNEKGNLVFIKKLEFGKNNHEIVVEFKSQEETISGAVSINRFFEIKDKNFETFKSLKTPSIETILFVSDYLHEDPYHPVNLTDEEQDYILRVIETMSPLINLIK